MEVAFVAYVVDCVVDYLVADAKGLPVCSLIGGVIYSSNIRVRLAQNGVITHNVNLSL
jgi:hypothetical protein